tara:strand:- start:971 stop:1162 length:192 start_codon:yes stop_codon:yes gene_type:complete
MLNEIQKIKIQLVKNGNDYDTANEIMKCYDVAKKMYPNANTKKLVEVMINIDSNIHPGNKKFV